MFYNLSFWQLPFTLLNYACVFFHLFSILDILYQVPAGVIVLLSIFYGSISIIAVIGNSLVIWIVATTRQMQTVTNLFIANLALADVVIGMFVIPFQVFNDISILLLTYFYRSMLHLHRLKMVRAKRDFTVFSSLTRFIFTIYRI